MNAPVRLSDPFVRRAIEDEIERLIALLDFIDPDPDLEPWLAGNGVDVTDDREGDDERENDDAEGDRPGFIWGGGEEGRASESLG